MRACNQHRAAGTLNWPHLARKKQSPDRLQSQHHKSGNKRMNIGPQLHDAPQQKIMDQPHEHHRGEQVLQHRAAQPRPPSPRPKAPVAQRSSPDAPRSTRSDQTRPETPHTAPPTGFTPRTKAKGATAFRARGRESDGQHPTKVSMRRREGENPLSRHPRRSVTSNRFLVNYGRGTRHRAILSGPIASYKFWKGRCAPSLKREPK